MGIDIACHLVKQNQEFHYFRVIFRSAQFFQRATLVKPSPKLRDLIMNSDPASLGAGGNGTEYAIACLPYIAFRRISTAWRDWRYPGRVHQ